MKFFRSKLPVMLVVLSALLQPAHGAPLAVDVVGRTPGYALRGSANQTPAERYMWNKYSVNFFSPGQPETEVFLAKIGEETHGVWVPGRRVLASNGLPGITRHEFDHFLHHDQPLGGIDVLREEVRVRRNRASEFQRQLRGKGYNTTYTLQNYMDWLQEINLLELDIKTLEGGNYDVRTWYGQRAAENLLVKEVSWTADQDVWDDYIRTMRERGAPPNTPKVIGLKLPTGARNGAGFMRNIGSKVSRGARNVAGSIISPELAVEIFARSMTAGDPTWKRLWNIHDSAGLSPAGAYMYGQMQYRDSVAAEQDEYINTVNSMRSAGGLISADAVRRVRSYKQSQQDANWENAAYRELHRCQ